MHPLVFLLLIAAGVCFILSFVPPMRGSQYHLWVAAAVLAVIAILLHLFVFAGGVGAADDPQGGVAHLVPGVLFENATYTGPPSCENMLLTSMNPDTPLRVCAIVRRPPEGGGLYILTLFTADGILVDRDLREYGYEDCFGADPWVSNFTGTIKATVNCKPLDGGNDRVFFPVDTHIGAE